VKKKARKREEFIFIAGPCVIETEALTCKIAETLKEITSRYPVRFIFKASFDKANRTSVKSFRGPGVMKGLRILENIKKDLRLSVMSDVHCVTQVEKARRILDIIQIPAFLCRQTDLIIEAAKTGKAINIKKGQFLSPYDVKYILEKIESAGGENIFITERGTSFGYNNLIVDFRSFGVLKTFGYPVIFDATHSVQLPSMGKGESAGQRQFVLPLAKAAVAFGVDGLFCEVHPNPKKALSDRATSLNLSSVESVIKKVLRIREVVDSEKI